MADTKVEVHQYVYQGCLARAYSNIYRTDDPQKVLEPEAPVVRSYLRHNVPPLLRHVSNNVFGIRRTLR